METTPDSLMMIPSTIDSLHKHIQSLGSRYRGTIIHCIYPEVFPFAQWINMLTTCKQPVVFFDSVNKPSYLSRNTLTTSSYYRRFHFDESAAVHAALSALYNAGHTVIGLHDIPEYDWVARRRACILDQAKEFSPPLTILKVSDVQFSPEQKFRHANLDKIIQQIENIELEVISGVNNKEVQELKALFEPDLQENTKKLLILISEHKPTALICMNDQMAQRFYLLSKMLEIKIPENLSLVSFDNIPESIYLPISSVDFGFENLGYLAAHTFINDISVKEDRQGNTAGVCTLIDRGSIVRPGKRRSSFAL